jgi:anti-sigma-K factor RskA
MEQDGIHDLTAAYALDALDEDDEREFEAHLRVCARCREELRELTETASSLAYAVDAPPPPPQLRERILAEARADRADVVPLRPRRPVAWAGAAVAAVAAAVAIGLGIWSASLSSSLDREREVVAILSDPQATVVPLEGANGKLVRASDGDAALVVAGLDPAPAGKTYEIWVAEGDGAPVPAGLFGGDREREVVQLEANVPEGAAVLVTVEDDGGVDAPTTTPFISART